MLLLLITLYILGVILFLSKIELWESVKKNIIYIILGLIILLGLYYIIYKAVNSDLQTLVDLQNKQVEIASKLYNNDMKPELKNALDFILQNIPPTIDIISKSL
jgi:hypothetical protein